jgi:hypothetical protein
MNPSPSSFELRDPINGLLKYVAREAIESRIGERPFEMALLFPLVLTVQ